MYQQVTSPLSRGYHVGASIIVGQSVGDGDPAGARFRGFATAALGVLTVGVIGVVLAGGADQFVLLFTRDEGTLGYAAGFARAYGLAAPATVVFVVLSGALQGGSDTRTPFVARTTGLTGFFLGFSYVASTVLGWGVVGIYAGIVLFYVWGTLVVGYGFAWGSWASRAAEMMEKRGTVEAE
jgi:Na+-driven multidrug efflux pump